MTSKKYVQIASYDERWPAAFQLERDDLATALGPASTAIHHVGSTSVPGLWSKAVIDILVESPDLDLIDAATPSLQQRGYEARGEYGVAGRRYFSRPPDHRLKVHVHVFECGNERIARHLRLRDYLRTHPSDASRYGKFKRALAETHAEDREAYQAGKADFIEQLHAKALEWHQTRS